MEITSIYLLIFFAALLHALWNIIIKSLNNSLVGIAVKVFFQSIIFFPIIFIVQPPQGLTWFYLVCSSILHSIYFILLGSMYNRGDMTVIYPIARGCAPVFVTLLSLIFLKDSISLVGIIGIITVSFGLVLLSLESFKIEMNIKIIAISLFIALIISIYTFTDGAGVRSTNMASTYIVWNFFLGGWISIGYVFFRKKKELFELQSIDLMYILLATIISFTAYAIIIWSMKHVPIGFVSSMRESSIIFASLIGYYFLKEKIGYIRLLSGFIFFIGVYLIYTS